MSDLTLEEKHHYGMCGGACRVCFEEQAFYDYRRLEEEAHYAAAMAEEEERHNAVLYEEEWWLEWLGVWRDR